MRRGGLSILKACSYIFYLKCAFGSHVTWNFAVLDPNVWCCILLSFCALDTSYLFWRRFLAVSCPNRFRLTFRSSIEHDSFWNSFPPNQLWLVLLPFFLLCTTVWIETTPHWACSFVLITMVLQVSTGKFTRSRILYFHTERTLALSLEYSPVRKLSIFINTNNSSLLSSSMKFLEFSVGSG